MRTGRAGPPGGITDAHHHLWRLDRGYPWLDASPLAPIRRDFDVTDLRAALASAGVDGAPLASAGVDGAPLASAGVDGAPLASAGVDRTVLVEAGREATAEVTEFLAIAEATDEVAGVVGWADLTAPDLADVLAAHQAGPGGRWLVGVRSQIQAEPDPDYLRRPDVHAGLATVAAAGLAFDLVVRADQLPAAAVAAAAVPQCRLVLDHLGKPAIAAGGYEQWFPAIAALARHPNTVAKFSGLVTEANWTTWTVDDLRPYVSAALDLFGPDRLMFGSDWPVCLLAASYGQVVDALAEALGPLAPAEQAEIWSGTAARVYGLHR